MTYNKKVTRLKKKKSVARLLEKFYRDEGAGTPEVSFKYAEKIMKIMEAKKKKERSKVNQSEVK